MNTNATHSEMPTLLTPADAATILHVPVKTLARWRFEPIDRPWARGRSETPPLPYVTLGRKVLYRESDLVDFVARNVHEVIQ